MTQQAEAAPAASANDERIAVAIERDETGLALAIQVVGRATAAPRDAAALEVPYARPDMDRALADATPPAWRWFADCRNGIPGRAWCQVAPDEEQILAALALSISRGEITGLHTAASLREHGVRAWGMGQGRYTERVAARVGAAFAQFVREGPT